MRKLSREKKMCQQQQQIDGKKSRKEIETKKTHTNERERDIVFCVCEIRIANEK